MSETQPKYIVDTCSFTAMRRVYPIDVFPSAWKKLDKLAQSGVVASTEDVFEEIKVQDDDILEWAKQNTNIFIPLGEIIQIEAIRILESHDNLLDLKKSKSSADPFIIATAMTCSGAVVTEEKPSGGPHKSKIPDVCKAYDVNCIPLLEMFRREGLRI